MKIVDIKTYLVGTSRRNPSDNTGNIPRGRTWVYVKVVTDQGIEGIGEAYSCGPDEATVKVIEDYKEWLIGQDPRNIQYLWDLMYNTTRFPGGSVVNSAISGIEHALWDVAGKAAGLPVWALLGGRVREKVLYQSIGGASPAGGGRERQGADRTSRLHGGEDVSAQPGRQPDAVQPGDAHSRRARWGGTGCGGTGRRHRGRHPRAVPRRCSAPSALRRRSSRSTRSGWRSRSAPKTRMP
ncbi:MAG: hypothetical protein R2748_28395 [Bryobacterales bacterium]